MTAGKRALVYFAIFVALVFLGARLMENQRARDSHIASIEKDDRRRTIARWTAGTDAKLKRAAKLCGDNLSWSTDDCESIANRQVSVGMNKAQVLLSWGKPSQINKTIAQNASREQWVYGLRSYLYFTGDSLTSMQAPGK